LLINFIHHFLSFFLLFLFLLGWELLLSTFNLLYNSLKLWLGFDFLFLHLIFWLLSRIILGLEVSLLLRLNILNLLEVIEVVLGGLLLLLSRFLVLRRPKRLPLGSVFVHVLVLSF